MKLNRITTLLMLSTLPLLADAASYTIVELPTKDLSFNQFGSVIDDTGLMITTLNQPINPPINLELLDVSIYPLTDPDAAAVGDFNEFDYNLISLALYNSSANNSAFLQKLSTQLAYQTDGTDFSYVNGFDVMSDATNGFTFGQSISLGDAVNGTHIVGTMAGPFNEIPYTTDAGVELLYTVNDFSDRAFVQVGDNVVELAPDDTSAGGVSSAVAINDNLQIAGTMTVGVVDTLSSAVANCMDDDTRGDQPIEVCLYTVRTNIPASFLAANIRRAVIWQVDTNGNPIDKTIYELAFEPDEDTFDGLSTQATAINDAGVAVGTSFVPISNTFTQAAVAFDNGETIRLLEDDDLLPNTASAINNNGYVIGFQVVVTTRTSNRMFILNRNNNDLTFTDGFFINSSTTPRAINNNNVVVGEAESDATQNIRPTSGFVYEIDTDTFSNINDLVACDSDYNIYALNDINDSGEIIGDAVLRRTARDFAGQELVDSDGNAVLVDVSVAVKLVPTGEAPTECEPTDEEIALNERQGASVGNLTIFSLLMICLFRRRYKSL